jgi:hypothetical protein
MRFSSSISRCRTESRDAEVVSQKKLSDVKAAFVTANFNSTGIQVNVLAPNYLYSEAYYPRARFVDDQEGREYPVESAHGQAGWS